jgi:hypothetical protein
MIINVNITNNYCKIFKFYVLCKKNDIAVVFGFGLSV